jgi:glycosyltransferase involved in cell wall biosynthesis
MSISAIVITKNEERSIAACLKALAFADEIIVVDAQSTDKTAEIAQAAGAKVFIRPWPGYGAQKNFGLMQAAGDWCLFIDADEIVTPQLAQEILAVTQHATKNFYWLKIVTIFLNKPLYHLYGHNSRLFKKSAGQWTSTQVHEQVEEVATRTTIKLGDDKSAVLQAPLMHNSHQTMASYLHRMAKYTDLDAKDMAATGKHRSGRPVTPSQFLPIHLALRQFLKMYIYKQGWLDGYAGFIWCRLSAKYEYVMAQKYLALKKHHD